MRIAALALFALAVATVAQGATSAAPVFEIGIDGKGRHAVIRNPNVTGIYDVSRDGKRILFPGEVIPDGLYVADLNGSHRKRIANIGDDIIEPVFSPDGRKVAFTGMPSDDCYCFRVWVVNSDGTGLRVVAQDAVKPTFSPDSKKLAYLGQYVFDGQYGTLTIASLSGARRKREIGPESNLNERLRLVWSPRGDRLAATGDFNEIRVYRVTGPGSTRAPKRFPGNSPSWSPDGTRIAFRSSRFPASVFVARADGSNRRWLSAGLDPVWSPDGRWIAFTYGRCTQVYVIRPARRGRHRVTHERCGAGYDIFWTPGNRRLIYQVHR